MSDIDWVEKTMERILSDMIEEDYEILRYVVVEHAGQDNEVVVKRGSYQECLRYIDFKYNDAEYDTLGVDIMGELLNGELTTEI